MKLSTQERRILACLQLQARATAAEIARQAGCREHTVRNCVRKLTRLEVIRPFTQINAYRLGMTDHAIYFSIANATKRATRQLMKRLQEASFVPWVERLGGEFQYVFSAVAASAAELEDRLSQLFFRSEVELLRQSVSTRVDWAIFRHRYLFSGRCGVEQFYAGGHADRQPTDDLDLRILAALAQFPGTALRDLARRLSIGASTIEYRVHRLEKRGVIGGYGYHIDASKFGMYPYRLLVFDKGTGRLIKEDLLKFCATHPHINCCIHCLGDWMYEISAKAENPLQIVTLCHDLMERFSRHIIEVRPLASWGALKFTPYPVHLIEPDPAAADAEALED